MGPSFQGEANEVYLASPGNKRGRLVVELAILVSPPWRAPMGGEDDHPDAEFYLFATLVTPLLRPLKLFTVLVAVSFGTSHRNENR